jgi:Cu-Zn family superoxide dismutase
MDSIRTIRLRALAATVAGAVCVAGSAIRAAAPPESRPESQSPESQSEERTTIVRLRDTRGAEVGVARLRQTAQGIVLSLSLTGVPAGEHAVHIHERGVCVPPFDSAGGHFDPGERAHGFAHPQGAHAGDLPNVFVGQDGRAQVEIFLPGLMLESGSGTPVVDGDGAALVVHAEPDDHHSDPSGNAGERIACGVIETPAR